jgi:ribosomal protein S18 acetylase RimI-like enzyme
MSVQFRPARAEDAGQAIPLIYSAGPIEFDYLFTTPSMSAVDFLRASFSAGAGLFGYKVYRVAVLDQAVVGIGAFYGAEEMARLDRETCWRVLKFYGPIDGWRVLRRSRQFQSLMPPPEPATKFIAQVGVAEALRGQGIGAALLTEQIELAQTKNYLKCALDVAVTNPRAQKLYERLGFSVVGERPWPYPHLANVPGMRRMELYLFRR